MIRTVLSVLLAILLLLPLGVFSTSASSDSPYGIHLTWQGDPSTTVTVVWETAPSVTESTVQYGLDASYGMTASGTTDATGTNGLIHIVTCEGLSPGTTYHYRCGSEQGGWSTDATFSAAPDGPVPFVFCSMGDSRDNPSEFATIVAKAAATHPAVTLFAGDLCGSDNASAYDEWFACWQPLGIQAPIAPALGNHEEGAVNYLHRFALPGNERWYSFNYSTVHFIVLSTSLDLYMPGSAQYSWLTADLKAAADDLAHPWKVVCFHNPPYNAGGHDGDVLVQQFLAPLFSECKVDVVFNGHNHYYERTFPLLGGGPTPTVTSTDLHYYRNPDGVIYVTTGSCGAPLKDTGTAYYLAAALKAYHFATVSVLLNTSLHLQTWLDDGTTLIDSFWIEKNLAPQRPVLQGKGFGSVGASLDFTVSAVDPEGEDVSYFIEWGDHTNSSWDGPFASGTPHTVSHTWSSRGFYTVKAKARDVNGTESDWARAVVVMPLSHDIPWVQFWMRLFERFPHLWPILRYVLGC